MRQRWSALLTIVPAIALTAGASWRSSGPDPRQLTLAWLREHAIPVAADSAPSGADLAAIDKMTRSARVVAFGEATHGTREFLALRNRIFEYLIEHGTVTTIGIESGFQEVLAIDAYLGSPGDGDPSDAVVRAMMSWADDGQGGGRLENRELLRWIHTHNASHPMQRVHVYGFDLSGRASRGGFPNAAASPESALAYVQRVDPVTASTLRHRLGTRLQAFRTRTYSQKDYDRMSAADRDTISSVIADLNAAFGAHAATWRSATSAADYATGEHLAAAAQQVDGYFRQNFGQTDMAGDARAYRDSVMAANVEWISNHGGAGRVLIFAHDVHVSKGVDGFMGSFLKRAIGPQLFVVGTVDGVRHLGTKIAATALGDSSTIAELCAETGQPAFMINLRDVASTGPVRDWLGEPHSVNPVSFGQSDRQQIRLLDSYDAFVFVRT